MSRVTIQEQQTRVTSQKLQVTIEKTRVNIQDLQLKSGMSRVTSCNKLYQDWLIAELKKVLRRSGSKNC